MSIASSILLHLLACSSDYRGVDDYAQHCTTIQVLYHLLNPAEEPICRDFISEADMRVLQDDVEQIQLFARRHTPEAQPFAGVVRRSVTSILRRR